MRKEIGAFVTKRVKHIAMNVQEEVEVPTHSNRCIWLTWALSFTLRSLYYITHYMRGYVDPREGLDTGWAIPKPLPFRDINVSQQRNALLCTPSVSIKKNWCQTIIRLVLLVMQLKRHEVNGFNDIVVSRLVGSPFLWTNKMLSDRLEISHKTQTHKIGLPKGSLSCLQISKEKCLCENLLLFLFVVVFNTFSFRNHKKRDLPTNHVDCWSPRSNFSAKWPGVT
jgi:hypothetical protein